MVCCGRGLQKLIKFQSKCSMKNLARSICKLLYKLNLFDSVKCNVLPISVCLQKVKVK